MALEQFREECRAHFARINQETYDRLVFGEGCEEHPPLMLIGEAPGEQEAIQLRPFVGKAGKNLNHFLQILGLKREEIYISNVVKIRPSKISPAGRMVNRPPSKAEKALFTPWLMKEIALVKPKVLVTLGNIALQAFVDDTIGNRHGRWSCIKITLDDGREMAFPLFALYHPASIIYNQSLKEVYAQDLETLKATLETPECIL